jgi:hypothetical protein
VFRNITFTGTHKATAGTVTFQLHGWTENTLVEYHIIEDYINAPIRWRWLERHRYLRWIRLHDLRNHSYQLAFNRRTSTFHQYISIHKTRRQSGPSTVANHFDAWKKAGMNLGEHDYQVLSTEDYNNAAGSTSQKISTGPAS